MVSWLWSKLTRQYNVGGFVGGIKDILTRVILYVSFINFLLLAVTAYHTTLESTLRTWMSWMTLPIFVGILTVLVLISMVIEYKIVLPSTIAYLNLQGYKHQNPIREQLDRVERTLADIQEKIQEQEKDESKHSH